VRDDGRPLFRQIAEQIESSIVDGSLDEEDQVPSTNELAAFHRINPATAAKGVHQLVTDGVIHKRRGIGMFVTAGRGRSCWSGAARTSRGSTWPR
jgi:DNA-binding transcriptional regulator YhcF (GntR family)